MMKGLETGRIQVAARALGVATTTLNNTLAYAQHRESFGQPIYKHQAIGHYLADMATKLTAARQLTLHAADCYDNAERADMEAGMAKYFASEAARTNAEEAMRFYGEAFGAEPQIMTFKDAGMDLPGEYVQGNNLQVSLSGDDAA